MSGNSSYVGNGSHGTQSSLVPRAVDVSRTTEQQNPVVVGSVTYDLTGLAAGTYDLGLGPLTAGKFILAVSLSADPTAAGGTSAQVGLANTPGGALVDDLSGVVPLATLLTGITVSPPATPVVGVNLHPVLVTVGAFTAGSLTVKIVTF
jgi:hypothetical protein